MKKNKLIYWIATILICGFMAFTGMTNITKNPAVIDSMRNLGFPQYFPLILGSAKLLGVLGILIPGFPRIREWAYAGFCFTFIGAFLSHLAAGDPIMESAPALVALVLLWISYRYKSNK